MSLGAHLEELRKRLFRSVVQPRSWGRWRRHGVVGNLVLAAVLAPGDPLSLAAFAAPLLLLYEIGAVTARFCAPAREAVAAPA